MIKRRLIFALLSVLCTLIVFGSGYALWTFSGDSSSSSSNLGVTVTQSSKLGKFFVPEIKYIVLDGGVGSDIDNSITGVSFYKGLDGTVDTNNSFNITFTVNSEYLAEMKENDNWDKVNFGLRINVPDGLDSLITHTDFYNSHIGENGYIDLKELTKELTDHFNDPDLSESDFSYDAEKGVYTFALTTAVLDRFFTYKAEKVPDSLEKYGYLGTNFAAQFKIELWQGYAAI